MVTRKQIKLYPLAPILMIGDRRIKLYMTMKVKHAIKKKAREAMERKQARNVMFGIVGVLFLLLVLGLAAYYFVQAE